MKEIFKNLSKQQKICLSLLAVYSLLTLIGVFCHENWADECQAWVIVRDNDLAGIFDALKYEGHPPLWYMILFPFVKLGFPLVTLSLISWFISVVTAYLVMMKSPFNTGMKAIIIFSCGFLFYNSVISRVYCVIVLLTCLLAILYKERKKYPVIFGLLVGLLAQTHVIMCGLVGIIGIYMIIDFFKDFKTNTAKKNGMNILGLVLAGIGVIFLVFPLLSSASSNNVVAGTEFTFDLIWARFLKIFTCIGKNLFFINNDNKILGDILGYIVTVLIVLALFAMRKYPKALIASLIFSGFFFFTTQIMFTLMLPSRASVYIYTLLCIFWIAKTSARPNKNQTALPENKFFAKLKSNKKADFYIPLLLCLVCIISIPRGVYWLVFDYFGKYTCAPAAAEFMKNELPDNSIIITNDDWYSQYCAKVPDLKIYSLRYKQFLTYDMHSLTSQEKIRNFDSIHDILKNYDHVYLLYDGNTRYTYNYWSMYDLKKIYEDTTWPDNNIATGFVDIYELTPKQVEELFLT